MTVENDKKNVLIFAGALLNNGITSALVNLLENVDLDRYNYFLTFKQWDWNITQNYESIFKRIPDGIELLPIRFHLTPTLNEKVEYNKFFASQENMELGENLKKLFKRSYDRQFENIKFDAVIDFDGYNHDESLVFEQSNSNNAIWVHSDMIQESKMRKNQNLNILHEVYSNYDNVVVVSDGLKNPTSQISGRSDNITTVHNIINFKRIQENADREFALDEESEIYPEGDICEILKGDGPKFITIGRFSPEKGHERLIRAFDEFCNEYSDAHLFIIGGHGVLYEDTIALVNSIEHTDNVTLIKGISNPMPVLKECDLFIFPSFYEGWGIVILEADTLGVPVIATDIYGTQWVRDYGGHLVDNSQEGLLKGMHEFMDGNVSTMDMDYKEFNRNAVNEFYSIIDRE